jgi:hypothetical protein
MGKKSLKYQLINPVKIKRDPSGLDFSAAQYIADEKVKSLGSDCTLVSWYNAITGESYPADEKKGSSGKPGWLTHAELCNCDTTVDINNEQFVFIYRTMPHQR